MRSIFLLFTGVGLVAVVLVRLLPWWAFLGLFAVLVVVARMLVRWGLPRLLRLPFAAKGAVLRAARVDVHSIERVDVASAESGGERARGPREHVRLEVTITPGAPTGAFMLWEPGELRVVGKDARPGDPTADEDDFHIQSVEIWDEGRYQPDTGMKYEGPERLRLLVALPPGQRGFRFRYYFEILGSVSLPEPALTTGR